MKTTEKQAISYTYDIEISPLSYKLNTTGVKALSGYSVCNKWTDSPSYFLTSVNYWVCREDSINQAFNQ